MKNIKVKLFTLVLVSVFIGCNTDFADMNVDPNNPSEALPDLLLSSALTSMSDVAGAVTGALYVQYFSETQYTEDSRYGTVSIIGIQLHLTIVKQLSIANPLQIIIKLPQELQRHTLCI